MPQPPVGQNFTHTTWKYLNQFLDQAYLTASVAFEGCGPRISDLRYFVSGCWGTRILFVALMTSIVMAAGLRVYRVGHMVDEMSARAGKFRTDQEDVRAVVNVLSRARA
jgi:hypothetical protein